MILVITKDGNEYINENNVVSVNHSRRLKSAFITYMDGKLGSRCIDNVEQVQYISNNHDVVIKEDGSDIQKLKKVLKEQDARYNNLCKHAELMRCFVLNLQDYDSDLYDTIEKKLRNERPYLFKDDTPKVNPGD
jgi:hypothetical protein